MIIINQDLAHSNSLHQLVQVLTVTLTQQPAQNADAAVLVAITNEEHPKLLLTRRASHMNTHAGEVSFAGGKCEQDDADNIATALREAEEETALPVDCVQVIGKLAMQTSKSGLKVEPIVAIIPADIELVADPDEIARIFWVDLAWLIQQPTMEYHLTTKIGDMDVELATPSWQVDDEIIWGLTGRIIADMLATVFAREVEWYYRPV